MRDIYIYMRAYVVPQRVRDLHSTSLRSVQDPYSERLSDSILRAVP